MYSRWSLFLLHTEKAGSLLWKGNMHLRRSFPQTLDDGWIKFDIRIVIEKLMWNI